MTSTNKVQRFRARKRLEEIPPHSGSIHYYDNWGCRCPGCSDAKKAKMKRYRKRLLMDRLSRESLEDRQRVSTSAQT